MKAAVKVEGSAREKNIGWIFAIEWQIHIKTSKGTLSPAIMEMENYPKWKETDIGDTPIFLWTMIMGGKVSVFRGFEATKDKNLSLGKVIFNL